jgi:lysophospholipase L1-like esterase
MSIVQRVRRFGSLVLLQLAIVLVLLEVGARLLDPLGISYYPETARYLDTLIIEEPIGYRHRPGLEGKFYGVPVKISSVGLRDREVGDKPRGEYRLLVMGDSVPFGVGVRYEDSFPHQLELLLNQKRSARQVRTINMGVPSYNTEQELIQLQALGLPLQPDAVILLFSSNDIEPKLWVFDKRKKWYADMVQRSYAGSLLYVLFRDIRVFTSAQAAAPAATEARDTSRLALDQYRPDSPRWQAIDRSLTEISRILRQRKAPFVLFTNNELPFIVEMLETVARREGFPLVNLHREQDPRWAGQDVRLLRNSTTDGHPSTLGNRVLATLMAENLQKMGIPPPAERFPGCRTHR